MRFCNSVLSCAYLCKAFTYGKIHGLLNDNVMIAKDPMLEAICLWNLSCRHKALKFHSEKESSLACIYHIKTKPSNKKHH